MEKKKEKYHVQIPVRFLFGPNLLFKYNYTKWIYTYIKLRYNYYIDNKPSSYFKLNSKDICALFEINRSTVFECLKELVKYELLSKGGRGEYKFRDEKHLVEVLIEGYEEYDDNKTSFLQIYFNKFCDLWNCGVNAKEVELYYYLVSEIEHDMKNEQWPEVKTSQTKACKVLQIDHRTFKRHIKKLMDLKYLYKNDKGLLFVCNPKPVELLKKDKPVTVKVKEDMDTHMEEDLDDASDTLFKNKIYEDGKEINARLKLDPKLGLESKKRKLYGILKHQVLNWKIMDTENRKLIYPVVRNIVLGKTYDAKDHTISVENCANFGIDVKKYEVN